MWHNTTADCAHEREIFVEQEYEYGYENKTFFFAFLDIGHRFTYPTFETPTHPSSPVLNALTPSRPHIFILVS